jgi:hypothetical protein
VVKFSSYGGFMRLRTTAAWFRSLWFSIALWSVLASALVTGLFTGAPFTYMGGQLVLGVSFYLSLWLLADRPLIDPVQAVVITVYWWFGVGPVAVSAWRCVLENPSAGLEAQVSGMEALWIVAPGLLVYAIVSRWTLNWFSRKGVYARFLLPAGETYRPRVLVFYVSVMLLSALLLAVLRRLGIQGQEETSFFGGTKTTIWWVGVIAASGAIAPMASSALMTALARPWKRTPGVVKVLIAVVVAQTTIDALFGGWKGPLAVLAAYYVCAYLSRFQRPPFVLMTVGAVVFLGLIAPFVGYGRQVALLAKEGDSAGRQRVFSDIMGDTSAFVPTSVRDFDVSLLFRGIYPLAGELTRRNGIVGGEWHGDTIVWGLETLVPRVLNPGKRDSNVGNFFCRTVGADIGVCDRNEALNSIAVSIPFEFVGNFGWSIGILSFGLIGFVWTVFVVWMLSPGRLSTHPLTPFLALLTIALEEPFGNYIAGLRDLVIPLLLCYLQSLSEGGK